MVEEGTEVGERVSGPCAQCDLEAVGLRSEAHGFDLLRCKRSYGGKRRHPQDPDHRRPGKDFMALMVFVSFGFLVPRASTFVVALLALTFSWGVEFSQLYHAPWIDAVRATLPGRLLLGNTFNWPDLPAYALGVALGVWVERWRRS